MAKGKYSNWAKSFGKSVKFGAKDVLTELAPSMAETSGTIADDVRELRQDLRKLRSNKRQIVNYLLGEEEQFSKYGGEMLKNLKSGAKTGKLYDPKRADKAVMKAMGMDDFDMDFGDTGSFDMNGGSDSDFGDFEFGSTNVVNMTGPSTEAMQSVALEVGKTNETIAEGFSKMSASSKNNFAISEALEKRFHSEKMSQLTAINNNLVSIVQYNNETTSKFVNASLEFYDKNLAVLDSINEAMLRLSPVPKEKKRGPVKAESPVDMFMQGGFSLKGYSQLVARNARNSFQNSMMGAIFPMMNNEMLLADMAANPWAIPLKWGIESIIPDRFKKSMSSLDKTVNSFMPAALAKLGNYKGDSSILQFISEIFGTHTKVATKRFSQNEYERGPIPFDGETKAAVTRIIPGYLSRMAATLEVMAGVWVDNPDKLESHIAEKAIVYNTSKDSASGGRFMRRSEALKTQKREERDTVTRSYSDSRWSLRTNIAEYGDGVDRTSEIDNYLIGLTNSNEDVKPKDIEQMKRFILMGETGKDADNLSDKELGSKDLQEKAEAVKFAIEKLTNAERLGMAGAERQSARVNLSNYNTFYGSDSEKGVGRHAFLSQLENGAATNLYADKDFTKVISDKYRLERLDDGTYTMPQDKITQYNKDRGYDKKNGTWLYTAKAIATDIEGNKGTGKTKTKEEQEAESPEKQVEKMGITDRIKQIIHAPFDRMADIFDEVNNKLHDIIFGKDGLGGNLEELILGKKGDDGRREGGWFSGAINVVKDSYSEAKTYLFGDGDKKEGILSHPLQKFSDMMDKYFFGDKKGEDGKDKPSIIDQMQSTVVRGFGQLASVLFGNKSDAKGRKKSIEEAKAAFNKAIPDIGKGAGLGAIVGTVSGFGGFGLLGSLFLPGGPIGGALVGGAMGLLSQSKGFREMLFGKETTDKDGKTKRIGGLISDKVQKFFKAKKTAIFGGASMGVISTAMGHGIAFGLMPSVVVGAFGPVVAGAAWGLLSHSKKFREMIFGKEVKNSDGTTKKIGGLLNGKMMRSFKVKLPRAIAGAITGIGSMGVISQLGLVGNMVALGPIPAAIAGAGLGIASASKKFTHAMFGYTDASGKYHSGALDRFKNYMNLEVLEPMKLYAREQIFHAKLWVRKNVFRTISRSIRPFKRVMSDTAKWMQKRFKMVADPITTGFTMIFKTLADKITSILDPVVKLTKKMAEWTMNRFKSAVKMSIMTALLPLRAIGGMMNMLIKGKDYKSSVLDAARGVGNALASGGGLVGALGTLGKSVFNPDLESDEEKQEKREAKAEKKALIKGDKLFAASRAELKERQRQARENGYNLTEAQIAEMTRNSEEQSAAEAKIVENAKTSGDPMLQMTAKGVEQRAQTNVLLTEIRDSQKAANEADGVKSDDDASKVDAQKKREEAEQAAADQQAQVAQDTHATAEAVKKMAEGADGKDGKKKGWLWSLIGTVGSIASGIMSFMGSIGTVGAAALGIYGLLKTVFGDKSKGGKSQQLTHSEQAGRAGEYGAKKISRFIGRHPKALLAIGKMPFELGKAGFNLGSKLGSKLTNRIYTKDEYYTHFKQYFKGAKDLEASYAEYLKNPDKFYKRTGLGKAVDKVTGVVSTIKNNIEGRINERVAKFKNKLGGEAAKDKKFTEIIIGKFKDYLTKFTKSDIFINLFGKETGKITKFVSGVTGIIEKIASPGVLDKLRKLFPGKVAEATAKTGVAATGIGLALTIGFGIYDGITGALEADRLFDVNPADVTMKMRLVSTFVNTFFGLPPMLWVDLILTAASFGALALSDTMFGKAMQAAGYDLKNFDHRKIFARYIFDLISDESESSKLTDDQKKFDKEVKTYANKHHKGKDFSKEEYREAIGNKTTWQTYGAPIVDKVLGIGQETKTGIKSFGERISGWLDDMTRWFRDVVKSITSFSPMEWFKELIGLPKGWSLGGAFTRIGERLDSWLPDIHPVDKTTKTTGGLWAKAKGAAGAVKNYFFGSANGYQYMNDAKWKDSFGKDGCGPMTLANMLGISPRVAGSLGTPGDNTGHGTKSSYFRHAAGQLGIPYRENKSPSDLLNALRSGAPTAIGGSSSNPNSPFYGNGHYIMAKGMDANGNVNIVNPTSSSKSTSIGLKQLMKESIGNGGYSGSFIGAGRMSLAEAQKNSSIITPDDVKRYEEEQAQKQEEYKQYLMDNDLSTKDMSFEEYCKKINKEQGIRGITNADREKLLALNAIQNRSSHSDATMVKSGFVDEETAAMADKRDGITAKTDGNTETITHADGTVTTRNLKTGKTFRSKAGAGGASGSNKLGLMDLMSGIGLGLANLFSAIWGGTKYKSVSMSDIKGGILGKISSLFGGSKGSGHRGNGTPDDIGKLESEPADGKYWVKQNGNVKLKGCHAQVLDVLETLGQWFYEKTGHKLVVTAGTNGRHAEGKYSHAQGWKVDVNDWYGPENLQGGYITDGNSLTQPFKEFGHSCGLGMADEGDHIDVQFADGYDWQDGKTYGGWSTHGGGGGSFDSSAGRIETKKAVWDHLVNNMGINRAGAAGIMGNIEQESGFRTEAYNPNDNGGPSGGLVQWHAGRFKNLQEYADSIGKTWEDIDSQMGYLSEELNGRYKDDVYDKIRNASSVADAVDTWVRDFEIPADIPGEIARRTPMAESYYENTSDFVGGANFMSGGYSSGNPLANLVTGGLFNMMNRYNERGRQKKVAELKKLIDAGVPEDQIPKNLLKYKKFIATPTQTPTAKVLTDIIAPNGKKFERNDIDYLLNSGYNIDSAIELLSKDKKYAKVETTKPAASIEAAKAALLAKATDLANQLSAADKKKAINDDIIKKYAETHKQIEVPKPVTVANANIASARVLPSKVDTGGASMDDLLISIRALDSHRELEQIIGYLSIIAKTGTAAASAAPKLDPRTSRQLKSQIDRTRNDARAGSPSNGISPQRYKDLLNTMEGLDGYLNKDMFTVAVDIAKGGNFRTS